MNVKTGVFTILGLLLVLGLFTPFLSLNKTGLSITSLETKDSTITKTVYLGPVKIDNSEILYIHNNYLGSPVVETDILGQVISRTEYKPYGESSNSEGKDYTGKVKTGTGTINLGAREYSTDIRRFTNPDPIIHDSTSAYMYATNNPFKYTDPTGMRIEALSLYPNIKDEQGIKNEIVKVINSPGIIEVLGFNPIHEEKAFVFVVGQANTDSEFSFVGIFHPRTNSIFLDGPTNFWTNGESFGVRGRGVLTIIHELAHSKQVMDTEPVSEAEKIFFGGGATDQVLELDDEGKREYVDLAVEAEEYAYSKEIDYVNFRYEYDKKIGREDGVTEEYRDKKIQEIERRREAQINMMREELNKLLGLN